VFDETFHSPRKIVSIDPDALQELARGRLLRRRPHKVFDVDVRAAPLAGLSCGRRKELSGLRREQSGEVDAIDRSAPDAAAERVTSKEAIEDLVERAIAETTAERIKRHFDLLASVTGLYPGVVHRHFPPASKELGGQRSTRTMAPEPS
jgi:hypothetical protein